MKHTRFPLLAVTLTVSLAFIGGRALAKDAKEFASTKPASHNEDAGWQNRHKSINERIKKGNVDLLMIGDSITEGWEGSGKEVWKKFYEKRNAVNLGKGGDQTQQVLWRLENGNIEGIQPKLAVLMIGTNNVGCLNPQEIAAGVQAIVEKLRAKLPQMKILVLAIFPRGADTKDRFRQLNSKANEIIAKLADDKDVFFLDIGPKFLDKDGNLSRDIMPDLCHPSAKGYEIWAEAIEPTVKKLMGAEQTAQPAGERAAQQETRAPQQPLTITGRVTAVAADGKSITVETFRGRDEEAKKIEVKLTDKTEVIFSGVGPGGAKPTEGYAAMVWTAEGSKDTATKMHLTGTLAVRPRADVAGQVEKVSADGKTLSFVARVTRGESREVEEKPVKVHVTSKTTVSYSFVAAGGAKPTEGYAAEVWWERGSKDAADYVTFMGNELRPQRGDVVKEPDRNGKVVHAAADGKAITLEVPGKERGDEPTKTEVKIDDKTKVTYVRVGPDGAKPAADYLAQVWLADGSQDTAAKVVLTGPPTEKREIAWGRVAGVKDGQGITLEVAGARSRRDEEPAKREIRFTDKTIIVYQGVGLDGAKPTEGYFAQVWLENGSKDAADKVMMGAPGAGRR